MSSTGICPNFLANGICENIACTHTHTIFTCEPCGFVFQSSIEYNQHLETKKHRSRVLGQTAVNYCSICKANVQNHKGWEQHIQERIHQQKADDAGVPPADVVPQPAKSTATATACDLCLIVVPNRFWIEHLNTQDHKLREQHSRFMTAVEQSEIDKNGVVVEGSLDFEIIDPTVAKVGKELILTVKSPQSPSRSVKLLEAKLASAQGNRSGVSS